jgi:hypothetical protein
MACNEAQYNHYLPTKHTQFFTDHIKKKETNELYP